MMVNNLGRLLRLNSSWPYRPLGRKFMMTTRRTPYMTNRHSASPRNSSGTTTNNAVATKGPVRLPMPPHTTPAVNKLERSMLKIAGWMKVI